jgi:REP element-mobilizing transposase RayT
MKGYDYTLPGAYFVTLCARWRDCIFGDVVDGQVGLTLAGQVARDQWLQLARRFPQADFPAFVIMPNHVHGIVIIHDAKLRGAGEESDHPGGDHPPLRPYDARPHNVHPDDGHPDHARPHVVPGSLGAIVRAYNAAVTWRIHASDGYSQVPVWQRNYYDHIIRNETELQKIWDYIDTNPAKWTSDQLHPAARRTGSTR